MANFDERTAAEEMTEFRRELLRLLRGCGFSRRGGLCVKSTSELAWIVKPEQLWSGPRLAVRVGIFVHDLAPGRRPSLMYCDVSTDYDFLSNAAPPHSGATRHPERGPYLGLAMDFRNELPRDERIGLASFVASEICQLSEGITTLEELASYLRQPLAERIGVSRRLRELLAERYAAP